MTQNQTHAPPYRHVAWCYDALASAYSLGAIDRAKAIHHGLVSKGDHVLYAGAGRGSEIAGAIERGAVVTCVEPCPAMASRLHRRLAHRADNFTIVPRPIQAIPAVPVYDLVIAHFFLNVFDTTTMPVVLEQLCGFVKPGGQFVIADFAPPQADATALDRLTRAAYYRPVNLVGRLLGICSLHPIFDYAPLLIEHGMSIRSREPVRMLPGLPVLYEVITSHCA